MTTVRQALSLHRDQKVALELLAHLLKKKKNDLLLSLEDVLQESLVSTFSDLVEREKKGEPLAYLLGTLPFLSAELKVDRRALIPRPETEILVEKVAKRLKGSEVVWDLCTGSGCIGIALKKIFPSLQVTLSDLSSEALSLAQENALQNGVDVSLKKGDLLAPFEGEKADVVIVNPPYVSEKEFEALDPSVKDFEPSQALLGGKTGLLFYERLSQELPPYLKEGGKLFLEMGFSQADDVKKIFNRPPWQKAEVIRDWSGKDRFFFLEKEGLSPVSLEVK